MISLFSVIENIYFVYLENLYCRPKLKEHMQYCIEHPDEISKLAKVKAQVSEVKGVMMENIEKVESLIILSCIWTSMVDFFLTMLKKFEFRVLHVQIVHSGQSV